MKNFETSKIEFSTDVNSIDTNNDDRNNPLRVPISSILKIIKLSFISTSVKIEELNEITGDLTIKDVTKSVV
jgi:polyisoprenoid-binding protein YceI